MEWNWSPRTETYHAKQGFYAGHVSVQGDRVYWYALFKGEAFEQGMTEGTEREGQQFAESAIHCAKESGVLVAMDAAGWTIVGHGEWIKTECKPYIDGCVVKIGNEFQAKIGYRGRTTACYTDTDIAVVQGLADREYARVVTVVDRYERELFGA